MWSQEQRENALAILKEVKNQGLGLEAGRIAVTVAITESTLRNVDYGDRPPSMGGQMSSSRGLFQQIKAWGPLEVRMNPTLATRMFLTGGRAGQRGLTDIPGWNKLQPWVAAQAVQGSEFKDGSNFKRNYDMGRALADDLWRKAYASTPTNPQPSPNKLPYQGRLIRSGDKGAVVTYLQRLLNSHGAALQVDGIFGPATLQAIRFFQRNAGLEVDGIVGPRTWNAL